MAQKLKVLKNERNRRICGELENGLDRGGGGGGVPYFNCRHCK